MVGTLKVKVLKADLKRDTELIGKMKPYVKMHIN